MSGATEQMALTKRWVAVAVSLAVLALLVPMAACAPAAPQGSVAKQQAKVKVRIAQPLVWMGMAGLFVAQDKGFFEEEGIDAEITNISGGGTEVQAVMAGEAEFASTAGSELAKAYGAGNPLLGVMNLYSRLSQNMVVSKKVADARGITSQSPLNDKIKALKGLTIGIVRAGALTDFVARYYLLKAGSEPGKDAQIVAIGAPAAGLAAIESGKIDAFIFGPPVSNLAVRRGTGILLINSIEGEDPELADFFMQALAIRPDYAKQNADTVRKVVHAVVKGNKWVRDNAPEQLVPILKPQFPDVEDDVMIEAIKSSRDGFVPDGLFTEKGVVTNYDFMEKAGFAIPRTSWDKLVTNDFAK